MCVCGEGGSYALIHSPNLHNDSQLKLKMGTRNSICVPHAGGRKSNWDVAAACLHQQGAGVRSKNSNLGTLTWGRNLLTWILTAGQNVHLRRCTSVIELSEMTEQSLASMYEKCFPGKGNIRANLLRQELVGCVGIRVGTDLWCGG